MKVQVTKVIAKEIAKYIETVCKDSHTVQVEEHGDAWYSFNMPGGYCLNDIDYNYNTGKYKVIAIYRPYEYYAPAVYISTDMLLQSFRRISDKTLQNLLAQIWNDYIEC